MPDDTDLPTLSAALGEMADDDAIDGMTFSLATMLATVTMELQRRNQWDENARLMYVLRNELGETLALMVTELATPPLPDGMHPIVLVEAATEALQQGGGMPGELPVDIVGWVLCVEAWMVSSQPHDAAKAAEHHRAAQARRVHTHPDRVECRVITMADRAGHTYQTFTKRGTRAEPVMLVTAEHPDAGLDGRVTHALRQLMDATPVGA